MSEEKTERKLVKCLNCGNVWETKAKRPQCSICKSTRTEEISEEEFQKLKEEINVDQHVEDVGLAEINVESNVDQHESTSESTSINVDQHVDQTSTSKSTSNAESTSKKSGVLIILGIIALIVLLFLGFARGNYEEILEEDESELGRGYYRGLSPFG
jgi:cobalamin biosynthesis Mg chelatase CobN